ncbi:MAG: type II toxin-antitoxin system RelE/ParE family toxin [Gemmataceae bacterium]|nr:type II toxin-antitoxin system RelE/ParE family toxin [Gemmataceae bacterium]
MAKVVLTKEAAENLEELSRTIHGRMLELLQRLEEWPDVSGVKKLKGEFAGFYRLRTGDYRLLFRVQKDKVLVERIGHRDKFYDE